MFGTNQNYTLYLKNKGLSLYSTPEGFKSKMEFDINTIQFMEVSDIQSLREQFSKFFIRNNIHNTKLQLIVAQDLVFSENYVMLKKNEQQKKFTDFKKYLPFKEENIQASILKQKTNTIFMATNRQLITTLMEAAQSVNCSITKVLPAQLIVEKQKDILEVGDLQKIGKVSSRTKCCNISHNQHIPASKLWLVPLIIGLCTALVALILKLFPHYAVGN